MLKAVIICGCLMLGCAVGSEAAKFPFTSAWVKTMGAGTVTIVLTISNGNAVVRCTPTWTMADTTPAQVVLDRIAQETAKCMFADYDLGDIPASGSLNFSPQDLLFAPRIVTIPTGN